MTSFKYEFLFSEKERRDFFNIILELSTVSNSTQLLHCLSHSFQWVLPHEVMICGIGTVQHGSAEIHDILHYNYPISFVNNALQSGKGMIFSPLINRWIREPQPQLIELDKVPSDIDEGWTMAARKAGLRNFAAHGMLDLEGAMSSFISFSRITVPLNAKHAYILKLFAPRLHIALSRVLPNSNHIAAPDKLGMPLISTRQKEILYWLHHGKTNWEIARILKLSDANIKYHVDQILEKLNAKNRAQAIALAVSLKIIEPEVSCPIAKRK